MKAITPRRPRMAHCGAGHGGARRQSEPDLILADYNLPNGMDGLQVVASLREKLPGKISAIILTGDISTDTLREIGRQDCASD